VTRARRFPGWQLHDFQVKIMEFHQAGNFFSDAVELRRHAQVSLLRMAIDGFIPLLSSPFVVWLVLSPKAWPRFSAGLFFDLVGPASAGQCPHECGPTAEPGADWHD
jgi:hypothetical protein